MAYPYRRLIKPRLGTPFNKGHRLAKGLVGLWLMNENTGTTLNDLSGNGNTGVITGATWVAGKFGSTLNYAGVHYVTIDNAKLNSVFDVGNPWSIVVWFNCGTLAGGWSWIWSKGFTSWESPYYQIDIRVNEATSRIETRIWNTDGTVFLQSNTGADADITINEWHQVAMVFDGANLYNYLDGVLYSTDTESSGTQAQYDTDIAIGSHLKLINSAYGFNGKIDQNLIYNRALSASEIAQLYREPFAMFGRDDIFDVAAAFRRRVIVT